MNGKLNGHIRERLRAPIFWHLATVGVDGAPWVSSMGADIEGECVMVNTSMGWVKEENPRRNPYVSLSHHDPAKEWWVGPRRGVRPRNGAMDPPGPGGRAVQPLTAPPRAKPPPRRRAIRTYRRITGVE
ncbi:pyridoxamine 5'-phosphate oxidase family protein [Streptomyces massasporeus]|uniref:pyridoxamine 5'-phosphate oxidase family protein n=1 Tax=Streptomyces massasporeus TaxID=67324 RepID=UPI003410177D